MDESVILIDVSVLALAKPDDDDGIMSMRTSVMHLTMFTLPFGYVTTHPMVHIALLIFGRV